MAKATFLKVWASVLAAVLAAGLLAATTFTPGAAAQDAACEGDIVLDPGHSGSDTGAAMVASFTTFSGGAEQMNQLLGAYPKELLDAFGIKDLGDVENYLNSQVFLLAPLALAFFLILAAAGAIAGAEERGTIDVLLGPPIPRWQLVVGSFAATALSLLVILTITGPSPSKARWRRS
jgi:hypothetical protein